MKKKGISAITLLLVLAVVLIATGAFKLGAVAPANPAGISTPTPTSAGFACQTDGTNDVNIATPNKLSTSATFYTRSSIAAYGLDGTSIASATSDGTSSAVYTALNIPCAPAKLVGKVYVLSGTSAPGTLVNSASLPFDLTAKLSDQALLPVSNNTNLRLTIRNVALANTSQGNPDFMRANETSPTTMGTGDTRSGYIDIIGNVSNSQFGSDDGGIIWAYDTVDAAVFSDKSFALSVSSGPPGFSLVEITCPQRELSFDSANRCWRSPAIKTSDGTVRLGWTMTGDLGNPATTSDPILYINDVQSFEEDAKVVSDTFSKGGTNVGIGTQSIGFDNS